MPDPERHAAHLWPSSAEGSHRSLEPHDRQVCGRAAHHARTRVASLALSVVAAPLGSGESAGDRTEAAAAADVAEAESGAGGSCRAAG